MNSVSHDARSSVSDVIVGIAASVVVLIAAWVWIVLTRTGTTAAVLIVAANLLIAAVTLLFTRRRSGDPLSTLHRTFVTVSALVALNGALFVVAIAIAAQSD
jgi:hypothetical protein